MQNIRMYVERTQFLYLACQGRRLALLALFSHATAYNLKRTCFCLKFFKYSEVK